MWRQQQQQQQQIALSIRELMNVAKSAKRWALTEYPTIGQPVNPTTQIPEYSTERALKLIHDESYERTKRNMECVQSRPHLRQQQNRLIMLSSC